MARRIESYSIPGPAGVLEALLEEPEERAAHTAAVVCHPHPLYGGTMHNKVVYRMARGLRHAGVVVLRFNFRGVGLSHGEHGHLAGEVEDARAALQWLRVRYPELPYGLAGFSFGARAITRLGCSVAQAHLSVAHPDGLRGPAEPCWLLAAGFATTMGPADYLESCGIAKTFLISTHDQFAPRAEFEREYARWAAPKRVEWIEAADHFFAGALDEFEDAVARSVPS
jgi:alpha/beta superfamily hydrolase